MSTLFMREAFATMFQAIGVCYPRKVATVQYRYLSLNFELLAKVEDAKL